MTKTCARCHAVTPLEGFHKQPSGPQGRHSYCKPCANAAARGSRRKKRDPVKKRKWILWTRYRMTPEQWDERVQLQGGVCPICNRGLVKELRPCVDHDHATGKVRGILCHKCNISIPVLDDAAWLANALAYLRGER